MKEGDERMNQQSIIDEPAVQQAWLRLNREIGELSGDDISVLHNKLESVKIQIAEYDNMQPKFNVDLNLQDQALQVFNDLNENSTRLTYLRTRKWIIEDHIRTKTKSPNSPEDNLAGDTDATSVTQPRKKQKLVIEVFPEKMDVDVANVGEVTLIVPKAIAVQIQKSKPDLDTEREERADSIPLSDISGSSILPVSSTNLTTQIDVTGSSSMASSSKDSSSTQSENLANS